MGSGVSGQSGTVFHHQPLLHWNILWLEELLDRCSVFIKGLLDVCVKVELDGVVSLLNFHAEDSGLKILDVFSN